MDSKHDLEHLIIVTNLRFSMNGWNLHDVVYLTKSRHIRYIANRAHILERPVRMHNYAPILSLLLDILKGCGEKTNHGCFKYKCQIVA